jgi:hypothetical protein
MDLFTTMLAESHTQVARYSASKRAWLRQRLVVLQSEDEQRARAER